MPVLARAALLAFYLTGGVWILRFLCRLLCPPSIRILFTHRVLGGDNGRGETPSQWPAGLGQAEFERRIRHLARWYHPITLEEAVSQLRRGRVARRGQVVMTFDDGYADNLTLACPILRRYRFPATFFLATGAIDAEGPLWNTIVRRAFAETAASRLELGWLGGSVALADPGQRASALRHVMATLKRLPPEQSAARALEVAAAAGVAVDDAHHTDHRMLTWEGAREIAADGLFSLGAHTVSHAVLSAVEAPRAQTEIEEPARRIEAETGRRPEAFAYPNGQPGDYDERHKQMLRAAGYTSACTTELGVNAADADPYALRREPLASTDPFYVFALRVAGMREVRRALQALPRRVATFLARRRAVVALAFAALVIRAVWVLGFAGDGMAGDSAMYQRIALNLKAGFGFMDKGLPTAWFAPGYPTFLAAIYSVAGTGSLPVQIAQAVIDVCSALLLYGICLEITRRRRPALLTLGAYAVYLPVLIAVGQLLSEALFIALVLASCYLLMGAARVGRPALFLAAGLALGIASLTRGAMLAFLAVVPLVLLSVGYSVRRAAVAFAWAGVGLVTVVAPWTARNYVQFGHFIPVQAQLGNALYRGNYANGEASRPFHPDMPPEVIARMWGKTNEEQDRILAQEAVTYLRGHARQVAWLMARKPLRLWLSIGWGRPPTARNLVRCAVNLTLFLLAVYAWVHADRGWRRRGAFAAALIAYFTAVHTVLFAVPRYILPVEPFLLLFACCGVELLARRVLRAPVREAVP